MSTYELTHGDDPFDRDDVELIAAQIADVNIARLLRAAPAMYDACKTARIAVEHSAPSSCWATGPLTGDPIKDYILCPGCLTIKATEAAIALVEGK